MGSRTVLVLGDQLARDRGPLAERPDADVLMIEATAFARRHPYHPHKLALVFAAMRQFRETLRAAGRTVDYRRVETFAEGLGAHFDGSGADLVAMRPASHGAGERLQDLAAAASGDLALVENETFLTTPARFEDWAGGREPPYRHEPFYRFVRRETGYLMDGDDPVGGAWNYDEENRKFPGADYEPPAPPRYEPDALTRETVEWVREEFAAGEWTPDGGDPPADGSWAAPGAFAWPTAREQALDALDRFVDERLPEFGPYQDAMVSGEWAMNHALLGASLNLGLLGPAEVVEAAIDGARGRDVPVESVEGFVRQVIGWREFVRHAYREAMPGMDRANRLEAEEDLPPLYWSGDTDMNCLAETVESVRRRGYSHHVQRLMVLSNFALTYGVEPRQLNEWFHAAYVDAYHWVTTPNVVEMGLYADGTFATKPYAASANYVDRMSDYCADCEYAKTETVGENACPFNALYWEFLGRNEERLRSNGRMGLVYSHWDDKDDDERAAIRERAAAIRRLGDNGEL